MLNTQINTYKIGKLLTPKKIFKFGFEKNIENIYEKVHFKKFDYRIIFNIYFLSIITCFFLYLFILYEFFFLLENFFQTLTTLFIFVFVFFTLLLFSIYYFLLVSYFIYKENIFIKKEENIERDLPEFLDNLTSNIKGGISIEKSLILSVPKNNPDFLKEITHINSKILLGKSVYESLREFKNRFDGAIIQRTMILILEGLKGGGNIEKALEKISENLKDVYLLNDEIKASSSGFSIIIRILTLVVTPVLFSLSITLLSFMNKLFSLFEKSENTPISFSQVPIEFFTYLTYFSYAMIILTSFFSTLIIAHLKNQKFHALFRYLILSSIFGIIFYNILSDYLIEVFSNII